MLGKTANGLFWLFRNIERSENTARLLETGLRIALTRSTGDDEEWVSVLATAGARTAYKQKYDTVSGMSVIDFLLRDRTNPASVVCVIETARNNARTVRTALTREVWESVNEAWMILDSALKPSIKARELPALLETIRQQSARMRGALHGTMLRNDMYDFSRLGTFVERADATARILDVKYYVLLPSVSYVGSSLDNVQWESILRSVSAHRSYRWAYDDDYQPTTIADFLILNPRMPRSLAFCYKKIVDNLGYLADDYGARHPCHDHAEAICSRLQNRDIENIFDQGLHEFIQSFVRDNNRMSQLINEAYRFNS
ncbi:MAG: alpha-E domain-containing protein [Hyphomicrobiales bacterium]|uniref:alpha-E domain-containing protein n=1 Tax=Nisaea sp. TaxID=2024842 RepID=UPI00327A9A49